MADATWEELDFNPPWAGKPIFVLVTQDGFYKTLWGPFESMADAGDWARGLTPNPGVEIATDVLWPTAKPVKRER